MICLFPALLELHIRQLFSSLVNPPVTAVPPRGLHRLVLSSKSVSPILAWLHAFNHLPNVDSVKLPLLRPHHVLDVRAALQQLGGALRHFDIAVQWSPMAAVDAPTVFDFSLHPNLKTLVIRDRSWGGFDRNQLHLWMSTLAAPALERLVLTLDLTLYDRHCNWAALDAFLCSARFPALRNVVFKCGNHAGHSSDNHEFLHEMLPLLEASGVVQTEW